MMKSNILMLLRNSEGYVSGQQLCDRFGVSRTAVWKVINQLREEGYQIESVSRKGYRLVETPHDIFSESEITSRLTTRWAGKPLHYVEVTGSTNTDAKQYAEEGEPHGATVVAGMQNAGKGRRGRSWQSSKDTSVYFSILLRPEFAPDKASGITLVMALSVAEAIEAQTGVTAGIKWPNDIVVNKKKICGILTEMSMTPEINDIQHIVVGVGVNTNNSLEDFPAEIRQTATSLLIETGRHINRAALLECILQRFESNYEMFGKTLDMSGLRAAYQAHLINIGVQVKVLDAAGEYTGVSRGINDSGELLVERTDGTLACVYAGEVSVRGLYGYT